MKPIIIKAWYSVKEVEKQLQSTGFKVDDIVTGYYCTSCVLRLVFDTGLNIMIQHTTGEHDILWVDIWRFQQR
jgi:hypothetical protein